MIFGHFYKPAAWANLSVPVLAVHWVRVRSSLPTSPARDGFEKSHFCKSLYLAGVLKQKSLEMAVDKGFCL